MPTEEELLKDALAGSSNLPDSAAYNKQRALKGIGFNWKPSDEQTKRDIQEADRRDKLIRMALEATRKPVAASKSTPPGVGIGKGLQILLESVKWNLGGREGPGPRDKGYKGSPDIGDSLKKLMGFPEIDLDNPPKGRADAQKGAEMATDMLHTTPAGAIAGVVKKVAPRVINSIYPFMPGRALKDTKYVQRNVRDPKELEHILETGYMLPKEGGKSQKYFTAVDEVNPVTPKGNTMLRIKREKVLPDEAVRAEDVEVFDFAKNLWKPLRETAPTVQTGRHTQSEGVSDLEKNLKRLDDFKK